ncbi:MAG: COX15/CtaA family protein [Maritimibacter sp.]
MAGSRSIFEEVGEGAETARKATPGMIDKGGSGRVRKAMRIWLGLLFLLVAAMILIGGLTRLTDSGLSITEWNLVFGTLPPLSEAAWMSEFAKYQQSPEFQLQNSWMELADFQQIYWWEWGHRLLGRVIGMVWIFGFLGFWLTKKLPAGWARRLLIIGGLIGIQGAVGWWMVSSGLTGDMVDVASYRLATHLGLAFVIFGLIAWNMLLLGRSEAELMQARRLRERGLFGLGTGLMHLAFLQIILGALAAGIDAGTYFNDWPWMAGQFFPPDAFSITPVWRNFFENPGLVQFIHRMVAYALVIFTIFAFVRSRQAATRATRSAFIWVAVMVVVQATLGILTVLQASMLHVAITHQLGAILLWVLIITARFRAGYPEAQSVRG